MTLTHQLLDASAHLVGGHFYTDQEVTGQRHVWPNYSWEASEGLKPRFRTHSAQPVCVWTLHVLAPSAFDTEHTSKSSTKMAAEARSRNKYACVLPNILMENRKKPFSAAAFTVSLAPSWRRRPTGVKLGLICTCPSNAFYI